MEIAKEKVTHYHRATVKNAEGKSRRKIDNNDDVAQMLRGMTTDVELREVASEYGFADRFDGWVKKGLNAGQRRMALGNVLRKILRDRSAEKAAE